ncbi:MAG: OmpA family protein [Bacteroidetes bacterium]|nr:MAG: OmpA family protein [Bacteroidota bacterium]
MQNNPNFKLIALGYTDAEGSDAMNTKLSKQRASAVVNYLAKIGVPKNQLELRAMGKANLVDKRNTSKGKANNRRVEFLVEML